MIKPRKIFRPVLAAGAIAAFTWFHWTISPVMAKRIAPREVEPVTYQGIKYVANHARMGFVEAWEVKTGKKLWEQAIYEVRIDPRLERDVQDVFITDLKIKNKKLIIKNETQGVYELNLQTHKVKNLEKDRSRIFIPPDKKEGP